MVPKGVWKLCTPPPFPLALSFSSLFRGAASRANRLP